MIFALINPFFAICFTYYNATQTEAQCTALLDECKTYLTKSTIFPVVLAAEFRHETSRDDRIHENYHKTSPCNVLLIFRKQRNFKVYNTQQNHRKKAKPVGTCG